jgi:hypothetical protein
MPSARSRQARRWGMWAGSWGSARPRSKTYAHLGVSELRRLRQLEDENARLKRLVADLTLDKHMLSEALRKNA